MKAVVLVLLALVCLASAAPGADARSRRPPVVVVVFDELPVDTLLDSRGRIDPVRYPAFAALAAGATWFPNTQAVHDTTGYALPAILDGRLPRKGVPPTARGHPRNVFTLFARHGYRLRVKEEVTRLCPPRRCGRVPWRRADWKKRVLSSERGRRFRSFVRSLGRGRPTLWFQHAIFPHVPWVFLPSGKRYRLPRDDDLLRGFASSAGFHDRFLTRQYQQRYLLQLGFADRLVGEMLARLRRTGLYDRALIVLTADHGLSFDMGVLDRRRVSDKTIAEVAPVPLLVKAPGQRRGHVDRSLVRTVDVLPTVARLLHWRVPWPVDGRRILGPGARGALQVEMPIREFAGVVRLGRLALARRRKENVRRRLRLFGEGHASLYRIGPHRGLLHRPVADLAVVPPAGVTASIGHATAFRRVDLGGPVLPLWLAGAIHGGRAGAERNVAVAVNGHVVATGKSFHLRHRRDELYGVLLPERTLRSGANRVEVFEVLPDERLVPLAATGR